MSKRTAEIAEMKRLYEIEKLRLREIALLFGCSPQAVHYRLSRCGVDFRPAGVSRPRKPLFEREYIYNLYIAKQLSARRIADELDCSMTDIYNASATTRSHVGGPEAPDASIRNWRN